MHEPLKLVGPAVAVGLLVLAAVARVVWHIRGGAAEYQRGDHTPAPLTPWRVVWRALCYLVALLLFAGALGMVGLLVYFVGSGQVAGGRELLMAAGLLLLVAGILAILAWYAVRLGRERFTL